MPDRARRILTTFGGADPTGMTARTLRALATLPTSVRAGLEVRSIIGAATAVDVDPMKVVAGTGLTVSVERDVADMIEPMAWADLTVTSGGTTVWELARMGAPALVVETAPSEHLLARGLKRVGLFDRLGPADGLDESTLSAAIARRLDDATWRADMARLGPSLVDGMGAQRVVAALASLGTP